MKQSGYCIPWLRCSLCLLLILCTLWCQPTVAQLQEGIPIPLEDAPVAAAAGAKQKNVIAIVSYWGKEPITSASFSLIYHPIRLPFYGYSYPGMYRMEGTANVATYSIPSSVKKEVRYTYTAQTPDYFIRPDERLLEYRFSTTQTYTSSDVSLGNAPYNYGLWTILLGDPTGNGVIDQEDSQWALDYFAGPIYSVVPSITSVLAADVNEDGAVDATDALWISQYNNGLRNTFWEEQPIPSAMPTSATDGVASNKYYRIQNDFSKLALEPDAVSNGSPLKQQRLDFDESRQRFRIVYKGAGEYEFISGASSSLVLGVASNKPTLQTRSTASQDAQRWYILRQTDGTCVLINKSNTTRSLTAIGFSNEGESPSLHPKTVGNRWILYRETGRINRNYYDESFSLRYQKTESGPITEENPLWNSNPTKIIRDINTQANMILGALLGVYTKGSLDTYVSTPDNCRLLHSPPKPVTGEYRCTEHNHGTYNGDEDPFRNGQIKRCTDSTYACETFDQNHPQTDPKQITTMWTGAKMYAYTFGKDGLGYYSSNRSSIRGGRMLHLVDLYSAQYVHEQGLGVYIHELAHAWSAQDHYHGTILIDGASVCLAGLNGICSDTTCKWFRGNPGDVHRPSHCIMNKLTGEQVYKENYDKLLCSYCREEMQANILADY